MIGRHPAAAPPAATFSGYASLFDRIDLGRDVVERGAFAASLRQRGPGDVKMLFQHDPGQPIGVWTELSEDRRGLYVRGRLSAGARRARELAALIADGALDGLSIGFRTARARADKAAGVRRILEADLWEISLVTFPMLPGARVERIELGGAAPPTVAGPHAAERIRSMTLKLNRKEFCR